jgi:hypothetical protein
MSFTIVSSVSIVRTFHALTHDLLGYWRIVCTSRRVEGILASGSEHRAVWTTRLAFSRLPTIEITIEELG